MVVAQAGEPGEVDTLAPQADAGARVVRLDGRSADHPFPLAEWLGDADLIVAGAGFNAYWESKWLGWFERTRFTAFPRPIDDQAWRLRACADHWPAANGADQLARWILEGARRRHFMIQRREPAMRHRSTSGCSMDAQPDRCLAGPAVTVWSPARS